MFRDNVPMFPDIKLTLGWYLGPATNVGSALTAKIPKSNGQIICRSTLRHLNNKEIHCPIHQEMRRVFNESITHHLGPNATEQEFPVEDLIPDYDFYDDDHDLDPDHGDLEVTPEMGTNYLNEEIYLPWWGALVKGHVTSRKRDKDGNPVGLTNANPILDTPEYMFTFNNPCNATQMGTNMFSLTQLLTIDNLTLRLDLPTRKSSNQMDRPTWNVVPLVSKYAAIGRMVPHPGITLLTSRSLTLLRLQNMQWPKVLTTSQPLTGGSPMYWRSVTGSYP